MRHQWRCQSPLKWANRISWRKRFSDSKEKFLFRKFSLSSPRAQNLLEFLRDFLGNVVGPFKLFIFQDFHVALTKSKEIIPLKGKDSSISQISNEFRTLFGENQAVVVDSFHSLSSGSVFSSDPYFFLLVGPLPKISPHSRSEGDFWHPLCLLCLFILLRLTVYKLK